MDLKYPSQEYFKIYHWARPKKIQKGGVEDMEFPGISKK